METIYKMTNGKVDSYFFEVDSELESEFGPTFKKIEIRVSKDSKEYKLAEKNKESETKINPFEPRFIFQRDDGRWIYQMTDTIQEDITNKKIYWKKDGKEYYMTMDEFIEFSG